MTQMMVELNTALQSALLESEGNPEMFAFLLTAPLAAWMADGRLDEETALEAIRLLHQLHPTVKI